ncbi:hypothetical protein TorRG33x02_101110, partial [Trema orientale]
SNILAALCCSRSSLGLDRLILAKKLTEGNKSESSKPNDTSIASVKTDMKSLLSLLFLLQAAREMMLYINMLILSVRLIVDPAFKAIHSIKSDTSSSLRGLKD